uniref:Large ribosomal subunit protein P2 n=2 Tax=cellular organisms TaxID=131567 RepID=R4WQC5_RIPPE|nr:ribosomal protein LP2 [Riptortus pedestris]
MRYVAAYLLSSLGGKDSPTAADIEKILSSVGIEIDSERVNKVIGELKGKNLEEVIAAGKEKLASVPTGGGGVPAAAAAAPAAASPAKAAEEKKEAKKEESDQSDDDMGFGLFD